MKAKILYLTLVALMANFALAACDREGPMEKAGEKIDKSVERAGESAERAGDKVERAVKPDKD